MHGYVVLGAVDGCGCSCGGRCSSRSAWGLGSCPTGASVSALTCVVNQAAQVGYLADAAGNVAYIPGTNECAAASGGGGVSNVQLAQVGGSLALTGINIAAATSAAVGAAIGAALGPATLGISAIIGLFPLLFGHHAAAVKKEQSILCSAVPAANNYLQIIDQGVQQGKATPAQGVAALNSLYNDFASAVAPIRQGTSVSAGGCNAACVMQAQLAAIIAKKAAQYQAMPAPAQPSAPAAAMPSASGPVITAPITSGATAKIPTAFGTTPAPASSVTPPATVAAAAAAASTPNWLGIAALVVGGFFLARAL